MSNAGTKAVIADLYAACTDALSIIEEYISRKNEAGESTEEETHAIMKLQDAVALTDAVIEGNV